MKKATTAWVKFLDQSQAGNNPKRHFHRYSTGEGFNYVVICDKINRRYSCKNQWLDYGAITCAVVGVLFHPLSISFWGIVEMLTTFLAIYGMLIVKKKTGNAWGCVFAFCFIWNAL